MGAVFGYFVFELSGDLCHVVLGTCLITFPDKCILLKESDNTTEIVLSTNGEGNDCGGRAQLLVDILDGGHEVGSELVHLIDKAETWNLVFISLAPDSF